MPFWGSSTLPTKNYLVVLDIGTLWAKALVIYIENNEVCVVGRGYVKHAANSMRGGMITNVAQVADTCREAIAKATKDLEASPQDLIIGVNGQLVEGVTTTLHYDRAHPDHPLEQAELKNIIYTIQHRSSEKLRESIREKFNDAHPDVELIHAAVVETQLDGYAVENPIGFQGKRLSLTVFNAYLPLVYTSVLQQLAKLLGLHLISIATQPYGLSKLLVNEPGQDDIDGIFIDIGGKTTDVVIVKNGSVEGMQSFAVGGTAVTMAIKQELKLTLDRAEKLKQEYCKQASGKLASKISEAIKSTAELWRSGVQLSLREFPDTKVLPSKIYLTGGGSSLPDLKSVLQSKTWIEGLAFVSKPTVQVVTENEIELVADEANLTWECQDLPLLGLAKLTLDLASPDDVTTATLQTIISAMRHN